MSKKDNEKQVLIDTIKANGPVKSFGFYDFLDAKHNDLTELKRLLKPGWDATSEKVFKAREDEYRKLEILSDDLINFAFGDNSNGRHLYDITIMISKKDTE